MSSGSSPHQPFSDATFRKLEFHKVLERIADLTVSETGRDAVRQLLPTIDHNKIISELAAVSEAKDLFIAEGSVPLTSFKNISVALKKLTIEKSCLTSEQLLAIANILRVGRLLKSFLTKKERTHPALFSYVRGIFSDKIIEFNIDQAIDENGVVKDTASKDLREIRRHLASANEALRKKLSSILRQISDQDYLQEEIVTTRDGRFVIPVKSEYKNRISGFIHSTSSSGATVFVEPTESLELNNALRELQISEQREILRILLDLSEQAATIRAPLAVSLSALTELDTICARAKYSIEIIGFAPALAETPSIILRDARHPVLLQHMKRERVIPLTLEIGHSEKTLIITGPNAGGKTVALKLVGLLCACVQAGIHIPAAPDSCVYPFVQYFIDIGDDQSIDNDLSTFSSHLLSLKNILDEADNESLILIDEIGTGTDPSEGGALAAATLKELTERGALTIATTHHGMLKAFAHETSGIANGSMEFDQTSLTPTYRYRHGVPGSSYAFELAERIGINQTILTASRELVGDKRVKVESLLMNLEQQTQDYAAKLDEAEKEKTKLEALVKSFEQKNLQLKREVGVIKKRAVEEANEIVKNAHSRIEQSIKEIRENNASKEVIHAAKDIVKDLKKRISTVDSENDPKGGIPEAFKVGDTVKIQNGTSSGEIVEIAKDVAVILSGSAKLRIPLKDLLKTKKASLPHSTSEQPNPFITAATTEIDLRGFLGDEAVAAVENFLDNAVTAGLHRVDIIHGKGTGALRKRVTEFLKSYPNIKSFRLGEWNEGGTGVTVVEFS